jgi:hypothetical protein
VRAVAERFDIWTLYRLKSSGDRVMLQSFDGDGTLTVAVSGKFNLVIAERQVFGVPPDDLEECDLPAPDEKLGALMTGKEIVDNLDAMRVLVRPDLWVMTVNRGLATIDDAQREALPWKIRKVLTRDGRWELPHGPLIPDDDRRPA